MDKRQKRRSTPMGEWLLLAVLAVAASGCAAGGAAQRYEALLTELGSSSKQINNSRGEEEPTLFEDVEVLGRQSLVELVLDRNPTLEAARQAWRGALARYPQEKALDDPSAGYTFAPRSIGADDVRFGEVISVTQRFPFPGKRGLRGLVALAEAKAAHHNYEATRLNLALMASTLFDDFYVVVRSLEVNAEHIALVEDLKRSAEARYAAGRASMQDPLQAEVELAHLEHQRIVLRTQRSVVVAQINGLLHRRPESMLPPPPTNLPTPAMPERTTSELQKEALRKRPELQAAEARIEGAESALSLAKREYYPDFTVGGTYNSMWRQPEHQFMVGLSINLPIQLGRRRGAAEEARAGLHRSRSEYETRIDEIRVSVEQARVRATEATHVVKLFQDRLIPAARDQLVAARSGFESGQNTFFALIEGEKTLRTVELEFQVALAEAYRRVAELERELGRLPGSKEDETR